MGTRDPAVPPPDETLPEPSPVAASSGAARPFINPFPSYDPTEVAADRLIHILGVGLGVVGGITVIVLAAQNTGPLGIVATSLYAASLLAMVGFSAAYNLSAPSRAREILRRLDHATIFFLIAGTHSALTLGRIDTAESRWLALFAWSVAIAGATIKIVFPRRFERAAVGAYLALGAIVFLSLMPMLASLSTAVLTLISVGAGLYASGVAFHLWDSLRFQNAIWHAMVLCAACCHYVAIVLNM